MHGWTGGWLGGEELSIKIPEAASKLKFIQGWIYLENCYERYLECTGGRNDVDFLSIDIDSNDLYLAEELLRRGVKSSVIVVEYNGKFPPPVRFSIAYEADHVWFQHLHGDYMGASLQSYSDLLRNYDYFPVACNVTGLNAFFVHAEHKNKFLDVPDRLEDLFVPAEYVHPQSCGHWTSAKTIEAFLADQSKRVGATK